jgi:hypothetical protein
MTRDHDRDRTPTSSSPPHRRHVRDATAERVAALRERRCPSRTSRPSGRPHWGSRSSSPVAEGAGRRKRPSHTSRPSDKCRSGSWASTTVGEEASRGRYPSRTSRRWGKLHLGHRPSTGAAPRSSGPSSRSPPSDTSPAGASTSTSDVRAQRCPRSRSRTTPRTVRDWIHTLRGQKRQRCTRRVYIRVTYEASFLVSPFHPPVVGGDEGEWTGGRGSVSKSSSAFSG